MIQEGKSTSTKSVLGKGLASLLPGATPTPPEAPRAAESPIDSGNRDRHMGVTVMSPEEILTNPYQPRRGFDEAAIEELAQSIQSNGLIQPLIVRKNATGKYELIAGERRLRAAKKLGLKAIPVVVRKTTDRESLELALIENIQRQDLNCVDSALAYHQLTQEFSLTQEEIAGRVGKDRATVANHLRLLKLPEAIIIDLKREKLSFGHAKVLLGLEDPELCLRARNEILEKHLSVRDTEALVNELRAHAATASDRKQGQVPEQKTPIQQRLQSLSLELTRHVGARVELKGNEKRGRITIRYSTPEVLDRILELLRN